MKNLILLLLFLSNFYINFSQNNIKVLDDIKPPYNIKDYFLLLPDSIFKNGEIALGLNQRLISLKYKTLEELWNHKGHWQIDTIDFGNGYIKFSSTGDGAGTYVEITYFIKKDKSRLIAVNLTNWDMMSTQSQLRFYTFSNNIWKDVTKTILPKISLSDFLEDKYVKTLETKDDNPFFVFKLPQKGKTIKVKLDYGHIEFLADDNNINFDIILQIEKLIKYRDLIWHDGIFKF